MLKSIKYVEYEGQVREWKLDRLDLQEKNLVVGKNSTGKTRTLNIVASLARTISGSMPATIFSSYEAIWDFGGVVYKYSSSTKDRVVEWERLEVGSEIYLSRESSGEGVVLYEKIESGLRVNFQCQPGEYSIAKQRDKFQHGMLEPLFNWASLLRHYKFSGHLGKEALTFFTPSAAPVDESDENAAVPLFRNGKRDFGSAFVSAVINDMQAVGFDIIDIELGMPITFMIEGLPGEPSALIIREKGVEAGVDQYSMSSGMYRVLALLIHLNYMQMKGKSACVVIDDIGEGLDYERSCALIELLRHKAETTSLQVVMSTNDNFVMDEVPLQEWTVLKREGSHVSVRNYKNSAKMFDDFRFTGLSNFSFFEMDYLNSDNSEEQ